MKILNPLQSIPCHLYYSLKKNYNYLNTEKRQHHIVVSLTSFPPRLKTLHYTLKSILTQKYKPDVLFLCLSKEEIKDETLLPLSILKLKKYGLQIYLTDDNLKPHKKYFYAMKIFPNSIIITIDDDSFYNKNLVKNLYNSYLKYPKAVSAKRVHKILRDSNSKTLPYNKWCYEYKKEVLPSFDLLTTGVGGVLYPPNILPQEAFDDKNIKELCINADDIWLKFMEVKNNVPVVWTKGARVHPLNIIRGQKQSLQKTNYHENMNDLYIDKLQKHYGINI